MKMRLSLEKAGLFNCFKADGIRLSGSVRNGESADTNISIFIITGVCKNGLLVLQNTQKGLCSD